MKSKFTILTLSLLFLTALPGYSQEQNPSRYFNKAQFAGNIGLISLGAGKSFAKQKLEADLFLGYLPEQVGGDRIYTWALKGTYIPFRAITIKSLDWQLLRVGVQVSHTFGEDYFICAPPDKYPQGYYGFPTANHLYFLLGGGVNFLEIPRLSKMGMYYEVGSNLEYIISYAQNPDYLSPGKIFNLALGLKRSF